MVLLRVFCCGYGHVVMELKNILKISMSLIVLLGGFWLLKRHAGPKKPVVAILQIASHPAFDAARCGFMDAFTAGMGSGYSFLVKSADGSMANAQIIAQSVTSRSDVVAFVALGTPAVQALVQKETERPIFFTAVTYPEEATFVQNNVAGIVSKALVASVHSAGLGMDYYQLGFSLGKAATRVFLNDCSVDEIGFVYATPSVALNKGAQ
jgi:ABC-type uncharacterized transport system substrate-binding protein